MVRRTEQVSETIMHHAADFFARESNRESLITVTRSEMKSDFKNVTIFFSVLPVTHEEKALGFTKRVRTDFREYLKEHSKLNPIPTVDFQLDYGEKNRQRVDELTRN